MGRWSDLAARLKEGSEGKNNSIESDDSPAIAAIVPIVPRALPPFVRGGLRELQRLPAPRLSLPVWPDIVADALRLATEGWAEKALALGWQPLHLWGAHLETPGLAVWLCRRRIVLLDERTCTVLTEPGSYAVFTARAPAEGACFLWDYGRGGR